VIEARAAKLGTLLAGLAVTSHASTTLGAATFDSVSA